MATKKTSQAQRAASGSSKKPAPAKNTKQNSKTAISKKPEKEKVHIPVRLISSTVIAALFVLFLVMFLNPDGALVKLIYNFVLGLFGRVAFYISIPALLSLFMIHAFSGKRPIIMRSICIGAFVLICGCLTLQRL